MNNTYQNPVCQGADPFVLLHEGTYYLYSTNSPDGFRVYTSSDMGTWEDRGYCLRADDVMGDVGFWAPEVMERNGTFYMVMLQTSILASLLRIHRLARLYRKKRNGSMTAMKSTAISLWTMTDACISTSFVLMTETYCGVQR